MTGPGPLVWITRTVPGAARLADRVREAGYDAVVFPLLTRDPDFSPPGAVLDDVAALAFTSVNGLAFAALTPRRDWPVFAVGDRTAEAARREGFADVVSVGGDAQALAERIAADWGDRKGVLLTPGAERPAADLTALLAGRVPVRSLPVYRMIESAAPTPEAFDIVLLQSARAAEVLARRLTQDDAANRTAVALSPAVAAPIRALDFAEVRLAARPDENSLMEALGKAARPV
ncbi:uroporphyrinogen-III synthase [Brevundimonas goettingensis]|uniref:Uroporphyrinogen-III synthase n=1 Tax=Brevundimonas goettingensis TaxID=2774190 RepID=A0A975GVS9_9CAUL|nr:uroporphyrinogen-III synthase [Brevundimonas goettingensis]QTC90998.1 uroporphyrinogen-III synthase [Brevundimonas goettingensis]